jgi:hypothetical protein
MPGAAARYRPSTRTMTKLARLPSTPETTPVTRVNTVVPCGSSCDGWGNWSTIAWPNGSWAMRWRNWSSACGRLPASCCACSMSIALNSQTPSAIAATSVSTTAARAQPTDSGVRALSQSAGLRSSTATSTPAKTSRTTSPPNQSSIATSTMAETIAATINTRWTKGTSGREAVPVSGVAARARPSAVVVMDGFLVVMLYRRAYRRGWGACPPPRW